MVPIASTLPVVSAMITSIASSITSVGIGANDGAPNANGGLISNQAARPTASKLVMPQAIAIAVPASRPISTDRLPIKPEKRA